VLARIRVPRTDSGRPRTRLDRVLADKAYSSKTNWEHLRRRGIKAAIAIKVDQADNRRKKGSKGGRPSTPTSTSSAAPWSATSTALNATEA
jgi:IS5 family transposase